MAKKKIKKVIGTECYVKVQFGTEKLEHCVERMLLDKEKNMRLTNCNSSDERVK